MKWRQLIAILAGTTAAALLLPAADAQQAVAGQAPAGEPVFEQAFLADPQNIKAGEALWSGQCRHCHGASAYPGKAPKINPALLEPDFIYDRVTNGFQKMPPWKDVFSQQERMALVAYIKSKEFSP